LLLIAKYTSVNDSPIHSTIQQLETGQKINFLGATKMIKFALSP